MGFCVDCVSRHQPMHIKGAIDRKCSRIDCLANLASVTTVKRMCSYCGRWYCTSHFFTRDQLTTELLVALKKFRVIDGEGCCEECLKRDPVGAMIVRKKGFLGAQAAEMGERIAGVIEQRLPQIAHSTGEQLARGTVEGIKEEKQAIVKVAQEALDAPVKQRIWGTLLGLVCTYVVAIVSMALAKKNLGEFFHTYRWVTALIFGGLFLLTTLTTVARLWRVWRAAKKAGVLGEEAKKVALGTVRRAMWMNLPLLILVLLLTAGGFYWFVLRA